MWINRIIDYGTQFPQPMKQTSPQLPTTVHFRSLPSFPSILPFPNPASLINCLSNATHSIRQSIKSPFPSLSPFLYTSLFPFSFRFPILFPFPLSFFPSIFYFPSPFLYFSFFSFAFSFLFPFPFFPFPFPFFFFFFSTFLFPSLPFPSPSSFSFHSSVFLSVSRSVRPIFEALYLHNGAR